MNRFSSPSSPYPKQVRHGWMPGTLLLGCILLNTLVAVPAAQRASAATTTIRLHSAANASRPTLAFTSDDYYLGGVAANQLSQYARQQPAKRYSAMHIAPLVPVADGRESRNHWHAAHPASLMRRLHCGALAGTFRQPSRNSLTLSSCAAYYSTA